MYLGLLHTLDCCLFLYSFIKSKKMKIDELFNLKESNIPKADLVEDKDNMTEHVLIRLSVGLLGWAVILLFTKIMDDDYLTLGSIILGAGFTVIWLLYLLIESFVLYSKKKYDKAVTNRLLVAAVVLFTFLYFSSLH